MGLTLPWPRVSAQSLKPRRSWTMGAGRGGGEREEGSRAHHITSPWFNRSAPPAEAGQLPGTQPHTHAGLACRWPGAGPGPDEAGSAC